MPHNNSFSELELAQRFCTFWYERQERREQLEGALTYLLGSILPKRAEYKVTDGLKAANINFERLVQHYSAAASSSSDAPIIRQPTKMERTIFILRQKPLLDEISRQLLGVDYLHITDPRDKKEIETLAWEQPRGLAVEAAVPKGQRSAIIESSRAKQCLHVANIEKSLPTVAVAVEKLRSELRAARQSNCAGAKIIHGYSNGSGPTTLIGAIRSELVAMLRGGQVALVIPGEKWDDFDEHSRVVFEHYPQLRKDRDVGQHNSGMTVAIFCLPKKPTPA
jgi:hypothetical protein